MCNAWHSDTREVREVADNTEATLTTYSAGGGQTGHGLARW